MEQEAFCLNCGGRIKLCRYRDIGGWEPDYDPANDPVTWRHRNGYAACLSSRLAATPRPEIVVLCGSTRFKDAFIEQNMLLTLQGKIVLSVGMFGSAPDDPHDKDPAGLIKVTEEQKVLLDDLHKRKIDVADSVLVLNVGGYVGNSTASEIAYARAAGKPVTFLESRLHGPKGT
jgi:hypothetical protein